MQFGDRRLTRGDQGDDVVELQIRLAGFRGTLPDGDFGPGTELQVIQFQRDVMDFPAPNGVADAVTLRAIHEFGQRYPLDFDALRCPCGTCDGFGQGRFHNEYCAGEFQTERTKLYEYPGIHRMILWALRGLMHYAADDRIVITSGYRCGVRNMQTGRTSTNHHGKAVDVDTLVDGEDKRDDMRRCDRLRGLAVERATAQIGWGAGNRKALEPSSVAPTWVHYDVRCYEPRYLQDSFFCRTRRELDGSVGLLIHAPDGGTAPQDRTALHRHNAAQLARLDPGAAGLVLFLLDELSRAGRDTYIRLVEPTPGGNSVRYECVHGDPDVIPMAARSLGFKSWSDGRLEAHGG